MEDTKTLFCSSKSQWTHRKDFFEIYRQFWHAPSKNFANRALGVLQCHSRTATYTVFFPLLKLRPRLNTVLRARPFSPSTADNQRWISDGETSYPPQEPRGLFLPTTIAFHFATLIHELRPLDSLMMRQFFTSILLWENDVLSDDISCDLIACYLPKQQPLSELFPKALC